MYTIFAFYIIGTLAVLADVIKLAGAVVWQCLNGWAHGGYAWKEWAYRYVPIHVNDRTLLMVYSLLSVRGINARMQAEHLNKNEKAWERCWNEDESVTYFEHQEELKDFLYGTYDASYNSCEVIAVYNALRALNNGRSPVSFPLLLNEFECSGITLKGAFGTSPAAVYRYFRKLGYDAKMITAGRVKGRALARLQEHYATYILTAYNDAHDLGSMIHTVSITAQNESYVIHNDGDTCAYHTLEAAVRGFHHGNGKPICLIGIS